MMELLQKAWAGWGNYITQGKLVALFLAVILFLMFYKKGAGKRAFVWYAAVSGACCIFPVTAAFLMTYQTKFYDYEWIWSLVPLTALVAYGLTLLLTNVLQENKAAKKVTKVSVALLAVAAILLCGTIGERKEDGYSAYMEVLHPYGTDVQEAFYRERAYAVVEAVREIAGEADVMLWAPIEVMEYAREADGGLRLLYGRNMWDESLSGFSYDIYDKDLYDLYLWMETVDGSLDLWTESLREDAAELPDAETCVKKAKEAGVNCILLSNETDGEIVQMTAEILGATARQTEEYWVIYE